MISATVILVLLVVVNFSNGSFPLSKLSKFKGDFYATGAHAFSNNTILMTIDATYTAKQLGLHPQVLVPPKPWSPQTKLALRLNYKKSKVVWARAFVDLDYSTKSCMDGRGNLYILAEGFGFKSGVSMKKISSDGKVLWQRSFKYRYGPKAFIDVMNIECVSNNTLVILARKEGRTHFVIVNSANGKLRSVPASREKKKFENDFVESSSSDGTARVFSNVFKDFDLEDMYIHCIRTKGVLKVSSRKLDTLKYPAKANEYAYLVVAPVDRISECPAVYVVYLHVPAKSKKGDAASRLIKIRKLCVNTLKDMPWNPGKKPHTRYVKLQERAELYPESLLYLPTVRSIGTIFGAGKFESFGKVDVSQHVVTLLGSKVKTYQPELWLFCYGQKKKPTVVAISIGNNKTKGYEIKKPYDAFDYNGFVMSRSGKTVVAYGNLYNEKPFFFGPLTAIEIRIPLKSL